MLNSYSFFLPLYESEHTDYSASLLFRFLSPALISFLFSTLNPRGKCREDAPFCEHIHEYPQSCPAPVSNLLFLFLFSLHPYITSLRGCWAPRSPHCIFTLHLHSLLCASWHLALSVLPVLLLVVSPPLYWLWPLMGHSVCCDLWYLSP